MRKFLAVIVALALCFNAQHIQAALTFGATTGDRLNCGSAASVDNLGAGEFSVAAFVKPSSTTFRDIVSKFQGGVSQGWNIHNAGGAGQLNWEYFRVTSETTYVTSTLPMNTTGVWYYVGVSNSTTGNSVHIYVGSDSTFTLTEPGYSTQTNGVGLQADDSARTLFIGNRDIGTPATSFLGDIAWVGLYSTVLSQAQHQALARKLAITANQAFYAHLGGIFGTSTVTDLSGNGNNCSFVGTITNAAHPFAYCPFCDNTNAFNPVFGIGLR